MSDAWSAYLRRMRSARGMTITDLANRAGLNRTTVSEWEHRGAGGITIQSVYLIAAAFGGDRREALEAAGNLPPRPGDALAAEIARQDEIHPDGYPATRDGIRLALAAADDELNVEALDAWRAGRCKCPEPRCDHHDWSQVKVEMIQAAAVLMRSVRSL